MTEETQSQPIVSKPDAQPFVRNENAALQNYFGLEEGDSTDKLDTIREYLRGDNKEYTELQLLSDLRGLVNKLGNAPIGTSQFMHIYTYAKLAKQARSIEQELESMIR